MTLSTFDPSQHPALTDAESSFVKQVFDFTSGYFQNPKFDPSHDFNHVLRVVANATHILKQEQYIQTTHSQHQNLSAFVVILGALLHDVDDRKYRDESSNGTPTAKQELLRLGMRDEEAQRIQTLVEGVAYSSEVKDPIRVQSLIREIPELAVVQDADRLDSIGAIGIARCFTFGGAKRQRTLESSVDHFNEKLVKVEAMMKTRTGKEMAAERTHRLKEYLSWWQDEINPLVQ